MTVSASDFPTSPKSRFWSRSPFHWRSKSISLQPAPGERLSSMRLPTTKQAVIASAAAVLTLVALVLLSNSHHPRNHIPPSDPARRLGEIDVHSTCQNSIQYQCDSCLSIADQAWAHPPIDSENNITWRFAPERDGNKFDLEPEQCEAAFPGLYEDMERAAKILRQRGMTMTKKDMDENIKHVGTVRAMVYNGELYIIEANDVNRFWFQSRALATLSAINRAVITARTPLPNVEFTLTILDSTEDELWEGRPNRPIMAYTRKAEFSHVWLMPDFGGWSYPETHLGTAKEVMQKMAEIEEAWPWPEKDPRIVWRGVEWTAPTLRGNLVEASEEKHWADIKAIKWEDKESMKHDYLPIEEHCRYMFLAYTEGRSYSGRLRYLQNCHSVIFSHKMQWMVPSNYLLVSEGPRQNYVEVERDFSDLEEKIEDLLANPEKARRIADNSRSTFRDRYLTPAADSCYWRRLLRTWRSVSFEPDFYEDEITYVPGLNTSGGTVQLESQQEARLEAREAAPAPPADPVPAPAGEAIREPAQGETQRQGAPADAPPRPKSEKVIRKRKWRGVPFETYALMKVTKWD